MIVPGDFEVGDSGDDALPAIGEPYMGGYFAGVIDTTKGNIDSDDQHQDGERYALILSPKSLEQGFHPFGRPGAPEVPWTTSGVAPVAAQTRWDGLSAQRALAAADFPAFEICAGLSYPDDGGSEWYVPALDEMNAIYRSFKPSTSDNQSGAGPSGDFPVGYGTNIGGNPSLDPPGDPFTEDSPAQTPLAEFQTDGSEALGFGSPAFGIWTATRASGAGVWFLDLSLRGLNNQSAGYSYMLVRPVRRVAL